MGRDPRYRIRVVVCTAQIGTQHPTVWDDARLPLSPLRVDSRTGHAHTRAALSWAGVRVYQGLGPNGEDLRVLRRPEQVTSPGFLRLLRRITVTRRHPEERGQKTMLDVDNTGRHQVGHVGDLIEVAEVDGIPLPHANITITDPFAISDIRDRGWSQTSFGGRVVYAPPPSDELQEDGSGVWVDPNGKPHRYDVEQLVDPDDPRVPKLAKEQGLPLEMFGPNHFAISLPRGRGGPQSELSFTADEAPDPATATLPETDMSELSSPTTQTIVKRRITLALPTSVTDGLAARGLSYTPRAAQVDVMDQEADTTEIVEALQAAQTIIAELLAKLQESEETMDEAKGKLAAAEAEREKMGAEMTEVRDRADQLGEQVKALESEVEPLRTAQLRDTEEIARKLLGDNTVALDSLGDDKTIAAIMAATVKALDPGVTDAEIPGSWRQLVKSASEVHDNAPTPATPQDPGFRNSPGFRGTKRDTTSRHRRTAVRTAPIN